MSKPTVECTGLYMEVAVFTRFFTHRGFIKRDIYLVETYGPKQDGHPLEQGQIKVIELKEGSGMYWPIQKTVGKYNNWETYHVHVDAGPLPDDLYQNSEIEKQQEKIP